MSDHNAVKLDPREGHYWIPSHHDGLSLESAKKSGVRCPRPWPYCAQNTSQDQSIERYGRRFTSPVRFDPRLFGALGYVCAAHKQGWFEVVAGKSVVAFRRDDEGEVPSAKCFGFVQTYDEKPRRRLWELMKSQGMQENQQVVFMSDGGENVRRVQEYLHPFSEHVIDWFHITMRLTVLQQQTKTLQEERRGRR